MNVRVFPMGLEERNARHHQLKLHEEIGNEFEVQHNLS